MKRGILEPGTVRTPTTSAGPPGSPNDRVYVQVLACSLPRNLVELAHLNALAVAASLGAGVHVVLVALAGVLGPVEAVGRLGAVVPPPQPSVHNAATHSSARSATTAPVRWRLTVSACYEDRGASGRCVCRSPLVRRPAAGRQPRSRAVRWVDGARRGRRARAGSATRAAPRSPDRMPARSRESPGHAAHRPLRNRK